MEDMKPSAANSCPLTPLTLLERAAITYNDCTSIIYHNITYTWSDTFIRCRRLASSLSSIGIKRGHVVSIIAPNIPAMYELFFAVPMAGAVLNTINTRLDAHTISVMLGHAESKLVFVDQHFTSLVLEAISLLEGSHKPPLVLIADSEGSSRAANAEFLDEYEALVNKGDENFNWVKPRTDYEPITLNYTSGTTSSPKGVVHCHKSAFLASLNSLLDWSVPKHPVILWTLPLFHANGWSFSWAMAAVGGTNVCMRKFDAALIYKLIDMHHVTHLCAAPVVLIMLTNASSSYMLKNPVHVLTAGSPPPAAVLQRVEAIGFRVTHGYGLTETGCCVISCDWKRQWNRFPATEQARLKARQGVRTVAMTEVDVISPNTGKSVPHDGSALGEIVLLGNLLMLGYLKDPKATSGCMKNGWLHTGDLAVVHQDGYIEIKDRLKDVIISGGENISSVEVESVLYTIPAVNEAAVVARPHEFWGETPCAFVSLNGKISEQEILEYCKARLPHYMVPKSIVIKDNLPKNSTGKVQKVVLREIAKNMGTLRVSRM